MCMRTNLKRLLALTLTLTLFTPLAACKKAPPAGSGTPDTPPVSAPPAPPAAAPSYPTPPPGAHRLRRIFPNPRRGPLRRRQDLLV